MSRFDSVFVPRELDVEYRSTSIAGPGSDNLIERFSERPGQSGEPSNCSGRLGEFPLVLRLPELQREVV